MAGHLATAKSNRAAMLDFLGRPQEAQKAYDAVIRELASDDAPDMAGHLATAFANRTTSLMRAGRLEEAYASADEFLERFRDSESPSCAKTRPF